jgi:hypothetical protein
MIMPSIYLADLFDLLRDPHSSRLDLSEVIHVRR